MIHLMHSRKEMLNMMTNDILRLELAKLAMKVQEVYMAELEAYSYLDELNIEKMAERLQNYDVVTLLTDSERAQNNVKLMLDKEQLDIETMHEWLQLPEDEKLDQNEVRVLIDSIKSMTRTAKVLKAMRSILVNASQMMDDLETVMSAMSGEDGDE